MGTVWLLIGCSEELPSPGFPLSEMGPVPEAPQRPGDPRAGYAALVNEAYVTCGVPYAAYAKTADPPKPSELLPGRTGRNAELPYLQTAYVAKNGVELVTSNCLACHAAFFNNELVIGLGNESLDFTEDPTLRVESLGAYVSGEAATAAWRKWADRIAAIAPYLITDTVGVNPAPNLTLALIAHRDPKTLAWSPVPLLEPPPKKPLPVSVPPWWRMGKKHALFYHTAGRGDHARMMMMESLVCSDTLEEAKAIDAYFPDIRAYIASLQPPAYPFPIDGERAARGRGVFEEHCARCHGTYGEPWSYPNLVIALDAVGTDPEYALQATRGAGPYAEWFNQSFYGERAQAAPAPGYIAPPLDGIWATAPYLHNGSVPTIEGLLDSSKRPSFWRRTSDPSDYDQSTLGWRYTALAYGKEGAADENERKQIYDTILFGYSNRGHTYGDALREEDRRALLEYLKTL